MDDECGASDSNTLTNSSGNTQVSSEGGVKSDASGDESRPELPLAELARLLVSLPEDERHRLAELVAASWFAGVPFCDACLALLPSAPPPRAEPATAPPDRPASGCAASGRGERSKRSTERGEGHAKLVGPLTKHHQYAAGGCLNQEPIGCNAPATRAGVIKATA